ncbi:hypothetical protein H0H92_004364 [Tricholoma furcatifolium]|nr:hypothetical protein H0H92_004364 [Tricholoma furcatifolium]
MDSAPRPFFPLICASLCISTLSLIFAILIIDVSRFLWILPSLFVATAAYHAVTILIANSESTGALQLFALANLIISYALTCLWAAGFAVTVTITVLFLQGRLETDASSRTWSMVVPCVCALLQTIVMGLIAILSRKERNRIRYADKWKWRPGHYGSAASVHQPWAFATAAGTRSAGSAFG